MKKSGSLLLFIILVLSTGFVTFAQARRPNRVPVVTREFAQFENISAFTDGQGTFIRWDMSSEIGNVGFFVYRVGERGLVQVSPSLILGSVARTGVRPLYGERYEYFDEQGLLGTSYVLVSMAADGRRQPTQPFSAKFTVDFEADTGYTKAFLIDRAHNKNGRVEERSLGLTRELQATVNASRLTPDPIAQRTVVSQPGVKIAVKTEGMYRVSRAELAAAGFDVNGDSTFWRLFVNGNEQAIIVGANNQYIEFYGKGMDTAESDTQIYYLIADTVVGKRMISKYLGSIGGNVVSNNYRFITEQKERVSYNSHIQNGDAESYFGQPVFITPALNEIFNLTSVDPAGLDAVVTVTLQGFYPVQQSVNVAINGTQVGTVTGDGIESFSANFIVPAAILLEGNNTLSLNSTTGAVSNYFDSVKINYSRRYTADQNRVTFFTPGYRRIDVGGFASSNIRVFDTTLDGNPQLITNLAVQQNGSTFSVRMPSNRPAVMYGVEDSGLLHSPSVTIDNPSTLASPNNTADVIIISYSSPEFMAASEAWASYRRSRAGGNFNVKVVDVADVFDEFSYGVRTGTAINQFLEYAHTQWQTPRPTYVLLIGGASRDHRNYEGYGYLDFVPTKTVGLLYEKTGSDEALADFNHDGLADMSIGRIPVRNATSLSTVFNKTTSYEASVRSLDRGALFAYDMPFGFDFQGMSYQLASQLPPSVPIMFVNRGIPDPNPNFIQDPMAHDNLINGLNTGKLLVNYSGHGSTGTWATTAFFGINDASILTNSNHLSIFTMLTCLNGYFLRPNVDSISEALLKAPNGAAVATWASTTDTTPDYQLEMGAEYYRLAGLGTYPRLGDLIRSAKSTISGSDVGYSWALLGDPMLKVR